MADGVVGACEAARVAELGQDRGRGHGTDSVQACDQRVAAGLAINLSLMQVGMDYSSFAGITDYMALISGRVYPTLGVSKLLGRALIMLGIAVVAALIPAVIAALREPSEALHHV